MKQYIKTTLFVLAASCVMAACSTDKLDITQRGAVTTNEYVTADDDECLQFIASVYSHIRGGTLQYYFGTYDCHFTIRYKLGKMAAEYGEHYQYNETATSSTYKLMYSYYYQIIYWCNMIIEYMPDNNVASASTVSQVVAEARAIRAIMMMQVVMLWGNPPLADHILNGEEGHTDASESLDWIESELEDCAADLPSKSSVSGQKTIGGRITKEAAYAYLGKAYLYDKEYTLAASTLYNKVISTGLYELIDDFNDLNSSASDFCSEFLWEYDFDDDTDYTSQEGAWDVTYFGWSNGGINFPDGYYTGTCYGYAGYPSEEFAEFMLEHEVTASGDMSSRYRGTMCTYEELLDESLFSYSSGSKGWKQIISHCQGYFKIRNQALADDVSGSFPYAYSKRNTAYMRYAEVLLNYAEAIAQGGTASGMTGLEALNIVRRRAGLADETSLTLDVVKDERRAELYDEALRFIDLVRWGDAASELADCGKYTYTFSGYQDGDNETIQSKDQWSITVAATTGEGFVSGKHELFPYPEDELSNNTNLSQNPNW